MSTPGTPPRPSLDRRGTSNRWILGGLSLLLVVFTVGFYLLQKSRDLPAVLVANRVLLFVLWYVNVVLILVVLFVLLRNFFKLILERHHRILGAKFKTKLVATYIGLSLIPVLLLFVISTQLLRGSIDRWFSTPLDETLAAGSQVAQRLVIEVEQANLRDAERFLPDVEAGELASAASRQQLNRQLARRLQELRLDYLAVYQGTDFVQGAISARLEDLPEPSRASLREALEAGTSRGQPRTPSGDLVVLSALRSERAAERPIVVVAGRVLDREVATASRRLIDSAQAYRQLEVQRDDLRASYLLIFLMMTLLILLASSWVGLYLARRVTLPIQALADGTRRIAGGELGFQVAAVTDDELGTLVTSFNRMSDQLATNERQLAASNLELSSANRRLASERALLGTVLENVAAGVVSVDAEARILTCNGAALAMLRQREEAVIGRSVTEAWADPERAKLATLVALPLPADGRHVRELQLLLDGRLKVFEVKVSSPPGLGAAEVAKVVVLEELTELIEAQQQAAWREAARRIAHEIKNPLTPIQLAAERLLSKHQRGDEDLGPALETSVATIVREVRTLQEMVDEFSRYARMPRPQRVPVALGALVEDVLRLYRDLKPGVSVTAAVDAELGPVKLDPELLRRALLNLLDNALEATAAPGAVEVRAGRQADQLVIEIADTGRGIPPEARDKLFLPYFSTKRRGSGLGLAIVQRIVADHQGRIRVEDNPPQGTRFVLDLPLG
jgi:two-component system, NtrC family, nitrogen regulation sensor histidine kinase NtrY